MDWLKQVQKPNYWLLALGAAIVALHLTLLDQAGKENLLSLSILLWLAIASLLWDKKNELKLDSGAFSTFLGIAIIAIVLLRSLSPAGYHFLLSPFLSGLALCLMASGVKRLHLYWRELLILSILVFYSAFEKILNAIHIPKLTAIFATLNLWILGFDVQREGIFITLPGGKVEVLPACAGIDIVILMFSIAVLFLLLFPQKHLDKIICILTAPLIGFLLNSIRVSILALLVSNGDKKGFEYWHGSDGSLLFAMISVLVFGIFCWFFYIRQVQTDSNLESLLEENLTGEKVHNE